MKVEVYNFDVKGCAQLIKDHRKRLGLTQEKFGELIDYKKSKISKLESGDNNITLKKFYTILNKLKLKTAIKIIEFEN